MHCGELPKLSNGTNITKLMKNMGLFDNCFLKQFSIL